MNWVGGEKNRALAKFRLNRNLDRQKPYEKNLTNLPVLKAKKRRSGDKYPKTINLKKSKKAKIRDMFGYPVMTSPSFETSSPYFSSEYSTSGYETSLFENCPESSTKSNIMNSTNASNNDDDIIVGPSASFSQAPHISSPTIFNIFDANSPSSNFFLNKFKNDFEDEGKIDFHPIIWSDESDRLATKFQPLQIKSPKNNFSDEIMKNDSKEFESLFLKKPVKKILKSPKLRVSSVSNASTELKNPQAFSGISNVRGSLVQFQNLNDIRKSGQNLCQNSFQMFNQKKHQPNYTPNLYPRMMSEVMFELEYQAKSNTNVSFNQAMKETKDVSTQTDDIRSNTTETQILEE